jgi:hypothetical protein
MKTMSRYALILVPLVLVACGKKEPEPAPAVIVTPPAAAPVAAAPAAPAELTDEQRALAEKKNALDYATMEDKYLNDPRAQWATAATVSSTFGDPDPAESSKAKNAIGAVDGEAWTNARQDIGFDWIELSYDKPVAATEVRLVMDKHKGVESVSKVELQDTEGKWNVIWSGVSEIKDDERGPRTWMVRTFEKTPYKVKAVKYTFANNVVRGYKEVDAAQLIGD